MRQLVNVFDLDMTIIDSSHRYNGNLDDWIKNSTRENIFNDTLLPVADIYFEFKKTNFTNIAVTAREMSINDFDYLKQKGLIFDMVLHRGSSRDLDHALKKSKLDDLFKLGYYTPFMAYDDKEENLEVFKEFGFKIFNAKILNENLR